MTCDIYLQNLKTDTKEVMIIFWQNTGQMPFAPAPSPDFVVVVRFPIPPFHTIPPPYGQIAFAHKTASIFDLLSMNKQPKTAKLGLAVF